MHMRIATLVLSSCLWSALAYAQTGSNARPGVSGWRPPGASSTTTQSPANNPVVDLRGVDLRNVDARNGVIPVSGQTTPTGASPGQRLTRAPVTNGSNTLPNDHGQVWREYDISSYALRVQSSTKPEQAIVDWILRETGYEAWHSTPVGLLSADSRTLRVYHTPQMQSVVADIVDRFVNSAAENHGFGLRIITIKNPNWRARALPLMKSLPVQSPGVQAWMLAKEDAALLMSELRRRTDYREHNPPHQMVQNGQSLVISSMRPRQYTKGIIRTQQTWPGYQPEMGQLDEGFNLEFSPLMAMDTRTTDAVIKLRLAQVEKMLPVKLEVPSNIAPNQRVECQVPQMTMVPTARAFSLADGPGFAAEHGRCGDAGRPKAQLADRRPALAQERSASGCAAVCRKQGAGRPVAPRRNQPTTHGHTGGSDLSWAVLIALRVEGCGL